MDMFRLDGRVTLITGAVCGIGFEIAKSLVAARATIVFNNLTQESVDEGSANYKAEGIEVKNYIYDVTDEKTVQAMVRQIKEGVGSIDILVNNAGIIKRIPMTDMSATDFRQIIDVSLSVPFITPKTVIPEMVEKGGDRIINICSMMSELGRKTVSTYAAAKDGLKMLIENTASEYGQLNIQCNGTGPGYVTIPQTAPLRELQRSGRRHPFDRFIVGRTPATRQGDPVDLAGPSVFPALQTFDSVNGHVLYVDGGILVYIGKQL